MLPRFPACEPGGTGWAMCLENVPMSSGLRELAKGKNGDKSGRTGFWPVPAEPAAEGPVAEGTGLLWLQEKMPSWRWYVDHARDAAGE